uniref:NUDIX domain-containing protein n=1 Tax=Anaerolinea thermolimosa TaxID=229919 RepID=A0A7C4KKA6_9CHLR
MARTQVIYGERVARDGKIRLGCSAAIFDESRTKVLLTRREDNGQWSLRVPGGAVDPGESVAEACAREVWEEVGLRVRILRLVGVYSDPHRLVVYPDGNKVQTVALHFEAEIVNGEPRLSNEVTEFGYFSAAEAQSLEMLGNHYERILDTLAGQAAAFIK